LSKFCGFSHETPALAGGAREPQRPPSFFVFFARFAALRENF
jgi:hypothetical protein